MSKHLLNNLSRRRFLDFVSRGLIAGTGVVGVNSHLSPVLHPLINSQPSSQTRSVYLSTFDPEYSTLTESVRTAMLAATNLDWLRLGDTVFVKVACNSNLGSPAVTSPGVLEGVVQLLQAAGAGTIYVGDMSGALFVRHLATETIGSTRENMRQNGLLAAAEAAGATIHCFDEVPFEQAYIPGIPTGNHHWGTELQVAQILDQVDHVINLPRLGKHVLAGASLGLKNAIGWISDHSRMVLHRDAATFHEKIVEVNSIPQLMEKTRLTLTLVDGILTTYGPDAGYRLALGKPLILASDDVASHDQVALLTLLWARRKTPPVDLNEDPYPLQSNGMNWWFVRTTWGSDAATAYQDLPVFDNLASIEAQTHINYAFDILNGGRPDTINVIRSGLTLDDDLVAELTHDPTLGIVLTDAN